MKFYPLVETADGSGLFEMTGAALDAPGASVALSKAAKTATAGLRVAVAPYRAMSGMPAPVPPSGAELGQAYELLIEQPDDPGVFASERQILSSQTSDAAMTAYALQLFYGRRVALTPQVENKSAAQRDSASSSASDARPVSGNPLSSGGGVSAGGSAPSGSSVTSGGSASPSSGVTTSGVTSGTKGA